ncbi:hypothetical protein [Acinetobacter sp. Marseille-Q1618]|uniref:hypothetical protein n=1 Tax=Acinetobacter sp. Marseille-Q1618 TaxID=2697502 RepID=UPI0020C200AB|nr:hypothetical protein [Acinetobacter sp. Marseille-Q1618]
MGSTYADDSTLKSLSDSELSEVQGQALMNLTYTDPSKANAAMASQNIGFYKLGMEADVELNANIKKLQLGCGGVNGAGGCDIDIDNLSLSGISDTREGRVGSSAKLTNPFVEFAIKNPNSASTREMMGFRLSAEKVLGMLTLGEENSDKPNGINSLSGYMKIKDATGTATTAARSGVNYNNLGETVYGKAKSTTGLISADFTSNDYSLNLAEGSGTLKINGQTISGRRMSNVNLMGTAKIDNIALSGNISASAKLWGLLPIPLSGNVSGNVSNLNVDVEVSENLGFIHKLPLNNPFSLSLQKQDIFWNGAATTAQRGWWLAIEDPVDIGNVTPSQKVEVTDSVIKQVIPLISTYLQNNPIECGFLATSCLAGNFRLGEVPLQNAKVNMELANLQLKNQTFAPNCYGALKFC